MSDQQSLPLSAGSKSLLTALLAATVKAEEDLRVSASSARSSRGVNNSRITKRVPRRRPISSSSSMAADRECSSHEATLPAVQDDSARSGSPLCQFGSGSLPAPCQQFDFSLEPLTDANMIPEELPNASIFTIDIQTASQIGRQIASETASVLELVRPGCKRSGLDMLLAEAKRLRKDQAAPSLKTIAVVGGSGEGKSSVVNSLLDFPELAKTGDVGEVCTTVITEYRQKTEDQHGPITIEVEYLSKEAVKHHIEELLWSYRNQHYLDKADEKGSLRDAKGQSRLSNRDHEYIELEAERAWSALKAAFGHHSGFGREMLASQTRKTSSIVAQLVQWSQELQWPKGIMNGKWQTTANDADGCCEKVSTFMRDKFWPFTKIIRIFIDAPVLRSGVIIADLPDLYDTNFARLRLTQKYLLQVDHVLLVTNIMRAKTDASLSSSLYQDLLQHIPMEEVSTGPILKMAIVCTKIDDINMTSNRRAFCGENKPISLREMARLEEELKNAKAMDNEALAKALKRQQKTMLIRARNDHVTTALQAAYASEVRGGKLDVFCVSNKLYDKYRSSHDADLLQISGIADLQQFCTSTTKDARLLRVQNFLRSELACLLTSVDLWATHPLGTGTSSQMHNALRGAVAGLRWQALNEVTATGIMEGSNSLHQDFVQNLFNFFERRNDEWEREAAQQSRQWTGWQWSRLKAWVLRYGSHTTVKGDKIDWNAELIWKSRTELDFQWSLLLEDCIPEAFQKLSEKIKGHTQHLTKSVKGDVPVFAHSLDLRLRAIEYELTQARQLLLQKLRSTRRNSFEPNAGSYILAEMIPTYRSAAEKYYGHEKASRQNDIVQGQIILDGTLFPNISSQIVHDITSARQQIFNELSRSLEKVFRLDYDDLDFALDSDNKAVLHINQDRVLMELLTGRIERLQLQHQNLLERFPQL
ncbi:hypothetical protein ABEF95_006730 [Exophiala dermatitidis]